MRQTFNELKKLTWQDPDRNGHSYWCACYDDEDLHIILAPSLNQEFWYVILCYYPNTHDSIEPDYEEFYKMTSKEIEEKLGITI